MVAAVVRGVHLELHPSPDYVSDTIRRTGDFYEAAVLDEIARRVSGGILVDVGAMIGNHTAYLAAFVPNDGIHAFEPVLANRRLLSRNVMPFRGVTVHSVALSDREGTGTMTVDPDNFGHAVIGSGDETRIQTLDSYGLQDVSLLKVDVEGYEPQVLAGAQDTIARCRPMIVVESWPGPPTLPGYEIVAEWERDHQTFMLAPLDN